MRGIGGGTKVNELTAMMAPEQEEVEQILVLADGAPWRPESSALRLCLLTFLRNYDTNDDDDNEQQYQQQHDHYNEYDPHRKTRFFFSFSFDLLTTLDQPVYFGVLRE